MAIEFLPSMFVPSAQDNEANKKPKLPAGRAIWALWLLCLLGNLLFIFLIHPYIQRNEQKLYWQTLDRNATKYMPAKQLTLNINTATSGQLQQLPGIGPKTAEKIINYRDTHGSFLSIEALTGVKGIGPKKLAKIQDQISI